MLNEADETPTTEAPHTHTHTRARGLTIHFNFIMSLTDRSRLNTPP